MTILHFCPDPVHLPANALCRGRTDLVLLEIDESRLPEPVPATVGLR